MTANYQHLIDILFAVKGAGVTRKQIEEVFGSLDKGKKPTTTATEKMGDFEKALRRVAIVAPVWMAFRTVVMGTMQLIKEQIKFLIDLETAMARIRIVGKGTEEQYKDLQSTLIALSVAYGSVASAALDAAVIFAQQGRSVTEIMTLTRAAMIASQILGTDMKTTVDNLTAAVESFNIPILDSISIIDKWISVEKQFAVTSKDLADATKAAGATANQLGITINAFLGDVAAVIEVTRKSGSEAARGLQFIYARLLTTGAKAITQIARIPIYLNEQKEATFALTNTYRSATDVLDDLAGRWDTLTNKERLSIAQNVASKRQLVVFMALMQNYNASLDARIIALSSAGQAEQAFGIIQETTAIKINRLAASWNNLTISIGDTTAFKGVLDVLSELINRWAAIINLQQAMRNEAEKVIAENKKQSETQISQAQNIKELIELRNQYLTRAPTDVNTKMLEKINTALANVMKSSNIKIDINTEDSLANLEKFIDTIRKQTIQQEVDIRFITKKEVLQEEMKKITAGGKITMLDLVNPAMVLKVFADAKVRQKEIQNVQQQLNNLTDERNKALEKGLADYEMERTKIEAQNKLRIEETSLANELTDAEEEKLSIQSKLNMARQSGVFTNEQLLDIEKNLIENSIFLYDKHEQNLKLSELEAQRGQAILQDLQKRLDLTSSILKVATEEESTIIRHEMYLKYLIYGEDYIKNSMEDRVKLAQALTEEADKQEKKSARLVELFKIAQKYGKNVAQEVAKFMGGEIDFRRLSTEALKALRRTLPTEFERGKAEEFFRTTPITFPEQITEERIRRRNIQILNQVMVEPISIDVRLESEQVIEKVKNAIIKELDNKKSEISEKINKQIEEF